MRRVALCPRRRELLGDRVGAGLDVVVSFAAAAACSARAVFQLARQPGALRAQPLELGRGRGRLRAHRVQLGRLAFDLLAQRLDGLVACRRLPSRRRQLRPSSSSAFAERSCSDATEAAQLGLELGRPCDGSRELGVELVGCRGALAQRCQIALELRDGVPLGALLLLDLRAHRGELFARATGAVCRPRYARAHRGPRGPRRRFAPSPPGRRGPRPRFARAPRERRRPRRRFAPARRGRRCPRPRYAPAPRARRVPRARAPRRRPCAAWVRDRGARSAARAWASGARSSPCTAGATGPRARPRWRRRRRRGRRRRLRLRRRLALRAHAGLARPREVDDAAARLERERELRVAQRARRRRERDAPERWVRPGLRRGVVGPRQRRQSSHATPVVEHEHRSREPLRGGRPPASGEAQQHGLATGGNPLEALDLEFGGAAAQDRVESRSARAIFASAKTFSGVSAASITRKRCASPAASSS